MNDIVQKYDNRESLEIIIQSYTLSKCPEMAEKLF